MLKIDEKNMKKYVLVAMLGAFCLGANAQSKSRFSIGPNAGVGSTWVDNIPNKQFKTHGNFGLSMVFSAVPTFGIGADVKYSFEGSRNEGSGAGIMTDTVRNLDYLRVPIKAIFFLGKQGSRMRPKISVGPSLGYLVGGKTTTTVKESNGNLLNEKIVASKDLYNRFDVGVQGAAGFHYRLVQSTWLVADVAYYHGLRDIAENTASNPSSLKNRNLGINLGVNFGL